MSKDAMMVNVFVFYSKKITLTNTNLIVYIYSFLYLDFLINLLINI